MVTWIEYDLRKAKDVTLIVHQTEPRDYIQSRNLDDVERESGELVAFTCDVIGFVALVKTAFKTLVERLTKNTLAKQVVEGIIDTLSCERLISTLGGMPKLNAGLRQAKAS